MATALLLGATGLVGSQLLPRLLDDPRYSQVIAFGRRLPPAGHPKLLPIVGELADLAHHAASLQADDLYCCLGTTIKQARTREAFQAVDLEAPLAAARAQERPQDKRYFLVSALGADPRSRIFYSRVKGELETTLAGLGFRTLGIVRPSLLLGKRAQPRAGEVAAEVLMALLSPLLLGPLQRYRAIEASEVADGLLHLSKGLATEACLQSCVFHSGGMA